jgi:hypothetical protein
LNTIKDSPISGVCFIIWGYDSVILGFLCGSKWLLQTLWLYGAHCMNPWFFLLNSQVTGLWFFVNVYLINSLLFGVWFPVLVVSRGHFGEI